MKRSPSILRDSATWLALLLALTAPLPALAGSGALDQTFGNGGKVTTAFPNGSGSGRAVVVQQDGRIVVAGTAQDFNSNTSYDFGVVRYEADGSLDASFGTGGRVRTDFGSNFQEFGNGAALQQDGRILVVGGSGNQFAIARYEADGSLDASFGSGGRVRTDVAPGGEEARSVLVQADGKVVVAGSANGFGIARYNANGSLDTTFAGDGTTSIRFSLSGTDSGSAVAIQADGRYVVAGTICPGGVPCRFGVERFEVNGTLDTAFGTDGLASVNMSGGDDRAFAIAVQLDGKLLVSGHAGAAGFGLARFNSDGTLDAGFGTGGSVTTSFGSGTYDEAWAIALQPDGGIITGGGTFVSDFSAASFALARHDSSGSPDPTFGSAGKLMTSFGGTARAFSLAFNGADRIVLAGSSDLSNGSFAVARYYLTDNTPPGPVVVTQPVDETTGTTPVTMMLSDVSQGGDTTLTTSTSGPPTPDGFKLGDPPTFYDLSTTAVFDSAVVCIHYTGVSFRSENQLRLLHWNGSRWVNVTTSLNKDADVICGLVTSLSPFAIMEEVCQVPGDVEPDGAGDGDVDLADVALARARVRDDSPLSGSSMACGDVAPGVMTCVRPRDERRWCVEGDSVLDLADVRVIHALSTGVKAGCDACPSVGDAVDLRLPGDITPAEAPDGLVDDSDVARSLTLALGMEEGEVEARLRADVAPASREDDLTVATGNGQVTVADVVLLMRTSDGLESLAWPTRLLAVVTDSSTPFESWSLSVAGWPAWAPVASVAASSCLPDDSLGEISEGGWSLSCVPDTGNAPAAGSLGVVTYRAPELVSPGTLDLVGQVIDASLASVAVPLALVHE